MLEVAANGVLYTAGLSAKFRGNHVGPVLWCVASTRTTRRSLILLLHTFSLAHARGGSQTRTGFCLYSTTTSYPSRSRWMDMQQWIRYCRSISSNIIVCHLEEAKIQAQPERGSCEPWSTHIARLLHETKLLFEPTIVVLVLASIAL